MKKKRIAIPLAASLLASSLFGAVPVRAGENKTETLKLGVAVASTTDASGTYIKRILDDAAAHFDAQILYVDHGKNPDYIVTSVEQLVKVGVSGIILCGTSDDQIADAISICDENNVYLAEFFHAIDPEESPEVYEAAVSSPYYVGSVHEDPYDTGKELASMLLQNGSRHIALPSRERNHDLTDAELSGIYAAVDEWNASHPDDPAECFDPIYAGTTEAGVEAVTKQYLAAYEDMDGIIPVRCGSGGTNGAINALALAGKKDSVRLVTDCLFPGSTALIGRNEALGGTGENYCDPLIAFMMMYQAVTEGSSRAGSTTDLICPPLSASSTDEILAFLDRFGNDVPFDGKKLDQMKKMTPDEFQSLASENPLQ